MEEIPEEVIEEIEQMEQTEREKLVEQKKVSRWNRKINIFGASVPVWVFLLAIAPVMAVATWVLIQTTWIYLMPFKTPTLDTTIYTIEDAEIGGIYEKDFTITNPNKAPLLIHSRWQVYIDGDLIGEGYSVDDLQQFLWMKHIDTGPTDEYGLYDGYFEPLDEWYPLIVPSEGTTKYTLVYHVPTTFVEDEEVIYTDPSMVIQIVWKPKLSVYDETLGFYDGEESWDNAFVPSWYT